VRHCWEAEVAGVHGLGDLGHHLANREHGNDAGLLANSLVFLRDPRRLGRGSAARVWRGRNSARFKSASKAARAFPTLLDGEKGCGDDLGV